jgi:hypothetical protein
MTRKEEIKKILDMSKGMKPEEVSDEKGDLDFKKLENHPINKEQIKLLKEMGVSFEELRKYNFLYGAMVLGRYLK